MKDEMEEKSSHDFYYRLGVITIVLSCLSSTFLVLIAPGAYYSLNDADETLMLRLQVVKARSLLARLF